MPNYRAVARRAARRYGLNPNIFERQIQQESGFDPRARSPAGATGIAQIMPATARGWGVNPNDPVASLDAAARNMAKYVKQFGNYGDALRAYNAGPGNVRASHGFAETNNYVRTILRGTNPKAGAGGTGRFRGGVVTGRTPEQLAFDPGAATAAALQTLGQRAQPPVTTPALPEFAARAAMPTGYAPPESSGPPVRPHDDLTQALQAITAQRAQGIPGTTMGGQTYRAGYGVRTGGGRGGGGRGKVNVAAGANRAGAELRPILMRALNHLSAVAGAPVNVGTGTNHSRMTTTGNVSDHWDGHGADVPLTGNTLTKRGRQALVAFGMSPAQARRAKGGIYNLNWRGHRVQVIFNTTEGGNHWNHLHVGIR